MQQPIKFKNQKTLKQIYRNTAYKHITKFSASVDNVFIIYYSCILLTETSQVSSSISAWMTVSRQLVC